MSDERNPKPKIQYGGSQHDIYNVAPYIIASPIFDFSLPVSLVGDGLNFLAMLGSANGGLAIRIAFL